MLADVSRVADVEALLEELYSFGAANQEGEAHLVASWRTRDPEALASLEPRRTGRRGRVTPLDLLPLTGELLHEAHSLAPGASTERLVWHCTLETLPGDRLLTTEEWGDVAANVLSKARLAPATGGQDGCRWVALRTSKRGVHIVAILALPGGRAVRLRFDKGKVFEACRSMENKYGLTRTRLQ